MKRRFLLVFAFFLVFVGLGRSLPLVKAQSDSLVVSFTPERLTLDPEAKVWSKIPSKTIPLTPQMIAIPRGGGAIKALSVQALHDGTQIAFRLQWSDPTADAENGISTYRDAVALQFPVDFQATPAPFMGNVGMPVNIWQWRADWQAEAEGIDIYKRQPKAPGISISPLDQAILKKKFPKKHHPKAACLEFIATGWGTLTKQRHQDVQAKGLHRQKVWTVVFLRDLKRRDASDARFPLGQQGKLSFAVWDGSAKEAFSRKSILMGWLPLSIAPRPAK